MLEVPDRTTATLLDAIKRHIAPGSVILSDSWAAYNTTLLEAAGYQHFKVTIPRISWIQKQELILRT